MPKNTKIRLTMLFLIGFEMYSRWVPLLFLSCHFILILTMHCHANGKLKLQRLYKDNVPLVGLTIIVIQLTLFAHSFVA